MCYTSSSPRLQDRTLESFSSSHLIFIFPVTQAQSSTSIQWIRSLYSNFCLDTKCRYCMFFYLIESQQNVVCKNVFIESVNVGELSEQEKCIWLKTVSALISLTPLLIFVFSYSRQSIKNVKMKYDDPS